MDGSRDTSSFGMDLGGLSPELSDPNLGTRLNLESSRARVAYCNGRYEDRKRIPEHKPRGVCEGIALDGEIKLVWTHSLRIWGT